jgi:hypothetical protein
MHAYEVRPRSDKRGVDLISDVLPFGRLWYGEPNSVANAIVESMAETQPKLQPALLRCRRLFPNTSCYVERGSFS